MPYGNTRNDNRAGRMDFRRQAYLYPGQRPTFRRTKRTDTVLVPLSVKYPTELGRAVNARFLGIFREKPSCRNRATRRRARSLGPKDNFIVKAEFQRIRDVSCNTHITPTRGLDLQPLVGQACRLDTRHVIGQHGQSFTSAIVRRKDHIFRNRLYQLTAICVPESVGNALHAIVVRMVEASTCRTVCAYV